MKALVWIPLLLPPVLGAVAAGRRSAPWTKALGLGAAAAILACGVALIAAVRGDDAVVEAGTLLRADALSAYLLTTVGAVAVTALWVGLDTAPADGRFTALICLFLAAMSLAVLADNLGILWVSIEATTITTAFLVGYHHGRQPLEAAWKYVVLGCVGVAIAFLGIVLMYGASRAAGHPTLSWVQLSSGLALDPAVTKIAVALTVLGFATKAGLAPMHSWLPDAHSQAPAPVSGLMSGVLLSVALYAILRVKTISDLVLGPGFMQGMLVTLALASLTVAAALSLTQRDYKRLLAYSSIEHMGLMAFGVAVGTPLAIAAVLIHMLGHGLAKAVMFIQAGRILASEKTTRIGQIHALMARRPDLAGPFLVGTVALLGFPPFALFFTEIAIILAGWTSGLTLPTAAVVVLLMLVFVGVSRHTLAMTLGPTTGPQSSHQARTRRSAQVPVVIALTVSGLLPLAAWPLTETLISAASAVSRP